jgi:hypothetical protein
MKGQLVLVLCEGHKHQLYIQRRGYSETYHGTQMHSAAAVVEGTLIDSSPIEPGTTPHFA